MHWLQAKSHLHVQADMGISWGALGTTMDENDIIPFIQKKTYRFVRELGRGACGVTVLLLDEIIGRHFVCKKYSPDPSLDAQALFKSFVREIDLLYTIHHPHVVRVFNTFLYPDQCTGFILMEHVDGLEIDEHLRQHPENVNTLFLQAIDAFHYLEQKRILHRDIRPANLMVCNDGTLKVIDLGFGKSVSTASDFDKSINLNWWCPVPDEFRLDTYNFATEVYFVGKLFELVVVSNRLEHFGYKQLLNDMCQRNPASRINSFSEVFAGAQRLKVSGIRFSEQEKRTFIAFTDELVTHINRIGNKVRFSEDPEVVQKQLDAAYQSFQLCSDVPDNALVLNCFLSGKYYYSRAGISVATVAEFNQLLKASSTEKRRLILANLSTRLKALTRFPEESNPEDIPF